jgi:hypothetical protein
MKSTGRQPDNQSTSENRQSGENLREQISRRAYELYLDRGERSDSSRNWLDAEKEILGATDQSTSEHAQVASAGREG